MNWNEQFVNDYKQLDFASFSSKYSGKVPQGTTIRSVVSHLVSKRRLVDLVDANWFGDTRDENSYYLLTRPDGKYEVFLSETGGKHWLRVYDSLEEAVSHKIDLIFNSLLFTAADSRIG